MSVPAVASRPRSPNSPERSEPKSRRGLVSRGQIQDNATVPDRNMAATLTGHRDDAPMQQSRAESLTKARMRIIDGDQERELEEDPNSALAPVS